MEELELLISRAQESSTVGLSNSSKIWQWATPSSS